MKRSSTHKTARNDILAPQAQGWHKKEPGAAEDRAGLRFSSKGTVSEEAARYWYHARVSAARQGELLRYGRAEAQREAGRLAANDVDQVGNGQGRGAVRMH